MVKFRQQILSCTFFALLLLLLGCSHKEEQPVQTPTSMGYQVVDAVGRMIELEGKPCRIVSLTYGTDELLTDLVGSRRIVGYSRWAGNEGITFVTKEQAHKVGCRVEENVEKILLLKPDLVFASISASKEFIQTLEDLEVKVYQVANPDSFEEMRLKVLGVAQAVGELEKGRRLVEVMDSRLSSLQHRLSYLKEEEKKVAVAFGFEAAIGRRGGLLDDMLTKAQVINGVSLLPENLATNHISKEQVVKINPDILLLPTWNYDAKHDIGDYYKDILYDPAYRDINAIKKNQIKFINDKYRYVNSHHVIDAIENISRSVYPQLFRGENDERKI